MKILFDILKNYNIDIENNFNIYPFNNIMDCFVKLLVNNIITIDEYNKIKMDYYERNKYLHLFEINSPRKFGENWAQTYILNNIQDFLIPNKNIDKNFINDYDFLYNGLKIEIKASRAVAFNTNKNLMEKALSTTSIEPFNMNFQQLKPNCCDIFIFISVWCDQIKHWLLTSDELKNNKYYCNKQHRNSVDEGQLYITDKNINEFDIYLVELKDIIKLINKKVNNDE